MYRKELTRTLAARTGLSPKESEEFLNILTEIIMDTVAGGERVAIPGFGVFEPRIYAASMTHDLKTQNMIQIPERRYPCFRPYDQFKETVRG